MFGIEQLSPARLMRIALLCLLSLMAIYLEAAPLGLGTAARPSPDLLLCVVAYWAIRRPGSTPVLLVFLLMRAKFEAAYPAERRIARGQT